MNYTDFLANKSQLGGMHGFAPIWMPSFLHDFQSSLVDWAVNKGRAAIFADCGLGKTAMQLVWAENVVRHSNGRVAIITPLAVSAQTLAEANKFGIEASRPDGSAKIIVTTYERLHKLDAADFVGAVCDESSILKSFDGARRSEITQFMKKMPYRLLCTATPSPNDATELGTSSEALGGLGHMDMLNRFFVNDLGNSATGRQWGDAAKWRFKGHAEEPFWRWVCSWARAIRKPSDIGFDDGAFMLPALLERQSKVEASRPADGMLFALPAGNLPEQREERRRTLKERCDRVASIVTGHAEPALVWCHLNDEANELERSIPGAVQVSGSETDEAKEDKLLGFARGDFRVLVTKPRIGAWGLNYQHCAHIAMFPSHSYEQYYQGVRRCWRFGQKRPVTVDVITTEGDGKVMANMRAKADRAARMFDRLVANMHNAMTVDSSRNFSTVMETPKWL